MTDNSLVLPSVNRGAKPLVAALCQAHESLRLKILRDDCGATVVDAGMAVPGGLEAGRRIAQICMGGLGAVSLVSDPQSPWPLRVHVTSSQPVLACLASQYAGWSLSTGEGKGAFRSLGSGPGRALARKEPLFEELNYSDQADSTCLVMEADKLPPSDLCARIAASCGIAAENLILIVTPTSSLSGSVQIAARVLEVALHKAHALHFPLDCIIDGYGTAPLSPPAPDFIQAMGRTNDTIIFGGLVHLFVRCEDDAAAELARTMPSMTGKDFGRPFARIFADVNHDFYAIDPGLFAPARVLVTNLKSGRTHAGGQFHPALLAQSFGVDP